MPRNPEFKTEIPPKVARTPQGTECIWHEFWKLRQRCPGASGIRARVRLSQPLNEDRRFVLETGGGQQIVVDDNEGGGGSQPIELLAGALAGCVAFEAINVLRRNRQHRVTGYEVCVEAEQAERPPRKIVAVRVHHIVSGESVDPAAVSEAIRLAEETCTVQALLRNTATITTTFEVVKEIARGPAGPPAAGAPATSEQKSSSAHGRNSGSA